ncbi:hypothetical protein QBC46DRAFT_396467 [Diplogelasinospora grovesii]|uniref:Uncharacterized protein n=1 Tax=Diplogelasinospora grovesii TaxID=303347 RepID=A0AAN6N015_9PEZI|nr:hypothetical protein QBC46DRAFT_396467 [Diplogelasinospora grovesii]
MVRGHLPQFSLIDQLIDGQTSRWYWYSETRIVGGRFGFCSKLTVSSALSRFAGGKYLYHGFLPYVLAPFFLFGFRTFPRPAAQKQGSEGARLPAKLPRSRHAANQLAVWAAPAWSVQKRHFFHVQNSPVSRTSTTTIALVLRWLEREEWDAASPAGPHSPLRGRLECERGCRFFGSFFAVPFSILANYSRSGPTRLTKIGDPLGLAPNRDHLDPMRGPMPDKLPEHVNPSRWVALGRVLFVRCTWCLF